MQFHASHTSHIIHHSSSFLGISAEAVLLWKSSPSVGLLSQRQMTARVAAMRGTNTWRDKSHNVTSSMSSAASSRHRHCSAAQLCRCVAVITRRCRRTSDRQLTMSVGRETSPSCAADCRNDSGHCVHRITTDRIEFFRSIRGGGRLLAVFRRAFSHRQRWDLGLAQCTFPLTLGLVLYWAHSMQLFWHNTGMRQTQTHIHVQKQTYDDS